jgi:hypothetical protein
MWSGHGESDTAKGLRDFYYTIEASFSDLDRHIGREGERNRVLEVAT